MSLEAWGDEGDIGPDGYVTEELYEELKETLRDAVAHLKAVIRCWKIDTASGFPQTFDAVMKWLDENTVDGEVP